MRPDIEVAVVGAGVVGLAAARALAEAGRCVMVLERHKAVGTETSSRNSEVIHAGIYYPPGSLRARLCVRGKELLYRFAAVSGVKTLRCGKLIVATSVEQEPALYEIMARAQAAGVDDLTSLTAAEARQLEPEINCTRALLSPSTGVVDSHGLMQALEGGLITAGGEVALSANVVAISRDAAGLFVLNVESQGATTHLTARYLVNAAGLTAPHVSRMLGQHIPFKSGFTPETAYFSKGHYYALRGRSPFRHLVYPVPSGAWLGIHLTLDVSGAAKFGPDHEWVDDIDYRFDDRNGARLRAFETAIRCYWPGLPDGALDPGPTGIRPKIYGPGDPIADFAIHGPKAHGVDNFIALHGIESPGLTASLAIGEYVAAMLTGQD